MRRDAVIPSMIDAIKALFAEPESKPGDVSTSENLDFGLPVAPVKDGSDEPDDHRHA